MTTTTTTTREEWTGAKLGDAIAAHYCANAKGWRRKLNGDPEGPAVYRGGDNEASFRVFIDKGCAVDARKSRTFNARQYAEEIAGCSLVEFMARWSNVAAPPKAKPSTPDLTPLRLRVESIGLWSSCRAVDDDVKVAAWITSRGLDASRVAEADVAGAIRTGAKLPKWARCNGSSWSPSYALVVPLRDHLGELQSLHARRIVADDTLPKTASPAGATTRGLVMMNGLARGMFAGLAAALEHVADVSRSTTRPALVIVEGLPSFLAWCADASDADEHAPAVVGILNGSWAAEHAARVPDGTRVVVDTDQGDAQGDGDRYAAQIVATFAARNVDLARMTRPA